MCFWFTSASLSPLPLSYHCLHQSLWWLSHTFRQSFLMLPFPSETPTQVQHPPSPHNQRAAHVSPALLVCCALHLFHSTLLNTNLWTSHSPTHKARRCFHACAHTASTFSWNVSHHFSYSLQSLRCSSSPAFSTRPMRLGHFRLTSASLQLQKQ